MRSAEHRTIYRKDYQPTSYLIEDIHLTFCLEPQATRVTTVTRYYLNKAYSAEVKELSLDGEDLKLISIKVDGVRLDKEGFKLTDRGLTLVNPPETFTLEVETEINPLANTELSGLYQSSNNYCTQCEAEGFRRITYFLDRPDVLAKFTTRIEADKSSCPVLLSNGNPVERGELDDTRHYTVWQDPFPKPCYLFALVAGDLICIEDNFVTQSGRNVLLQIFVEERNRDKCDHAMIALKKAMRWDEEVYGLEYDLDIYMIVAVDDFNMGAMENKGLNVFNSKYVLASPESATDQDYLGIEGVVAHEYFHNWTGNRVTCRDWFQLSLKEGLTVFRDQEFSADMNSRSVKRIADVKVLRNFQFREDAGPMAHPVRPDSYVEINNFYTVTVYNKGAEVIRMLHHLIGSENFRKGMDLYFQRFDGMAVTCDDFVTAMSEASAVDLGQFKLWYSQSGTPQLRITESWDREQGELQVTIEQSCQPTPGQETKLPYHIPVEIGLLEPVINESGKLLGCAAENNYSVELKDSNHQFSYNGFKEKPVLSVLRGFTAPVKVQMDQSREELAFLMSHDQDLYNRWDSAFKMSTGVLMEIITYLKDKRKPEIDPLYVEAFKACLSSGDDMALTAQALTLPSESYLAQQMEVIEPELINRAMRFVKQSLARALYNDFQDKYLECEEKGEYSLTTEAMGKRSLKNCCLGYLMIPEVYDDKCLQLCLEQFSRGDNMTDVVAALTAFSNIESDQRDRAFSEFYQSWKHDPLVIDKWFALQASADLETTLAKVKELLNHEAFSLENPNKVRSLIGVFCTMNHHRFHDEKGAGYRFLASKILTIDKMNPQIAARLVTPLISYAKYTQKLKAQMEEQLRFILMQKDLSADVHEIVKKSIDN